MREYACLVHMILCKEFYITASFIVMGVINDFLALFFIIIISLLGHADRMSNGTRREWKFVSLIYATMSWEKIMLRREGFFILTGMSLEGNCCCDLSPCHVTAIVCCEVMNLRI